MKKHNHKAKTKTRNNNALSLMAFKCPTQNALQKW